MAGGCLCGRVCFQITCAPLISFACHCRGCQKLTSSAFSVAVMLPVDHFALTQGETVVGALHKPDARYGFCDWCKSWVTSEPRAANGFINVRSTLFDQPHPFEPFIEMWVKEKIPWVNTPAKHSFDKNPSLSEFPALIEEYRALNPAF